MSRSIVFPEVTSLMLLNYGYVYLRDFEPVFSKMLRTCGLYFSFELTLVFKHVQVCTGDTDDRFLFYSFYLYLTLFLSNHFVFSTCHSDRSSFSYMLDFSGGGWGVLTECPALRYLWWFEILRVGRGFLRSESSKRASCRLYFSGSVI